MDKIIAQVYVSNDYSKFKRLKGNRMVYSLRVNRLIKSFSVKRILNPIVVNSEFQIIDGQGRFEACRILSLPIFYVIDIDADINDCRRMNQYNAPWTANDYIDSYAENGNKNYILLRELIKETKTPSHRLLRLMGKDGAQRDAILRSGNLKLTSNDIYNAKNVLQKATEILDALTFTGRANEAFYSSVKVIVNNDKYSHKRMLENCKKNRSSYTQMSGLENQLKEFSRIYNYRAKEHKLYFEDYMRNRGYNVRNYSDKTPFDNGDNVTTLMEE